MQQRRGAAFAIFSTLLLLLAGLAAAPSRPAGAAPPPLPPISLVPVVQAGLQAPLFVTHAGDGSGRLFVIEQAGRVRILAPGGALLPSPFLDIGERVLAGGEQGLLGLAFHPRYRSNGRFFVHYTRRPDGASVIAEYRVSAGPNAALPASERILLTVAQPFANHNGGMLAFGPDRLLYIALGDGGGGGDPDNRAQNPHDLLGKLLRLDVDRGQPYAIPRGNPFAGTGRGRGEVYALGFRNPWRFSFDRQNGRLLLGDVGQGAFEEIDIVRRGGNYGWRIMEGRSCFLPPSGCSTAGLIQPITVYAHDGGRCSVTGGYVYRGRALPAMRGAYLLADFCTGEILVLRGLRSQPARLLDTDLLIVSFGEDAAGELYVVGLGGTIHRIAGAAAP